MKVLLIDDEFMPAEHLSGLLKKHCPEVSQVRRIDNPLEGPALLKDYQPQLLFLDIEMPEMNAFEFIDMVGLNDMPPTVFTTAHSDYAVQAFKVEAIDYLLKPIDPKELVEAMSKARRLNTLEQGKKLQSLVQDPPEGFGERLALAEGQSYHFLQFEEIIRIEGNGSYSSFHLRDGRKLTVSKRLNVYNSRLEKHGFLRTHQSHIVNMRYIVQYSKADGGELVLKQEHRVPVSLKMKEDVKKQLGLF